MIVKIKLKLLKKIKNLYIVKYIDYGEILLIYYLVYLVPDTIDKYKFKI